MAMTLTTEGNQTILLLSGEVDVKSTPELKKLLNDVDIAHDLIVDGAELSYIDSSGVACLLMAYKKFAAGAGTVKLRAPSDALLSVLRVLKFDSLFPIEP